MFEKVKYCKNVCVATPDKIIVPEWNIKLRMGMGTYTIALTYLDFKLYVSSRNHPMLYKDLHINELGFDVRIWPKDHYVTFWCDETNKATVTAWLKDIQQKIEKRDYSAGPFFLGKKNLDITGSTLIFMGIIDNETYVIKCDWDSFLSEDFELADTFSRRMFLPLIERNSRLLNRKAEYDETARFWEHKIGKMDIAQWHLLMYEE